MLGGFFLEMGISHKSGNRDKNFQQKKKQNKSRLPETSRRVEKNETLKQCLKN